MCDSRNCGGGCRHIYATNPYKNEQTEAYITAINILAVEYLVKTYKYEEYIRRVLQVRELDYNDLITLDVLLSLNMHTSSLGAMITQGDYDTQLEVLLDFLDHPEER